MVSRKKNKNGRKKKYNKKTRKMKGGNPENGPFGYKDSGNLLLGKKLGEACDSKNKCSQNLWCNHYISEEDLDEWLLNYYDANNTTEWNKDMKSLYGHENEMFDAVGNRNLDEEFKRMEEQQKEDDRREKAEQEKKYRKMAMNTSNYCKIKLMNQKSQPNRKKDLIEYNKPIEEKIKQNEKILENSESSKEAKDAAKENIKELKKKLKNPFLNGNIVKSFVAKN